MSNLNGILFLLSIIILSSCNPDFSQWRGPNRDGIYHETDLLDTWEDVKPELLWECNGIGKGYASPAITSKNILVNGEEEGNSFLFSFDLNGKLRWKSPMGKEFMGEGYSATYPGSRSTPTVIDKLVYTSSGMGRVACFDIATGNETWGIDLIKDLGGYLSFFGYSESLLVDDNKVYCFAGGEENNMVALDRFTGETIWTSEALKDTFSYCSPILYETASKKMLITHSKHKLFVVDCEDGSVLSSYDFLGIKYDGEHCNSPIFSNGFIYFIANDREGRGAIKLQVSENGEKLQEVWSNSKIRNNFGGYLKIGDGLFTTIKGNWLKKLNEETGSVVDSIKVSTGSLIFADNKFICYGMNGEVNLINYVENSFEARGSFKVDKGTGQHFSHPVLADGKMYIRHGDSLLAYLVK